VDERRKYPRARLHEPVVVEVASFESLLAHVADLSLGGMYVEGVTASLGAPVVVHMRFSGPVVNGDWTIALPGTVRWARERGFGIQFAALAPREIFAIHEAMIRARPSSTRQRVSDIVTQTTPLPLPVPRRPR
jgi:hypothetical protein